MKLDLYTRAVLTVIAVCLTILTFQAVSLIPDAKASMPTKCIGELTANAWGGVEASIGDYKIEIICE